MVTFAHHIGFHSSDLSPSPPPSSSSTTTTLADHLQFPLPPLHSLSPSHPISSSSSSSSSLLSPSSTRGHRRSSHLSQIHHTDDGKRQRHERLPLDHYDLKLASLRIAAAAVEAGKKKKASTSRAEQAVAECVSCGATGRYTGVRMPRFARLLKGCQGRGEVGVAAAEAVRRRRRRRKKKKKEEEEVKGGGAKEGVEEEGEEDGRADSEGEGVVKKEERRMVYIKEGELGVAWVKKQQPKKQKKNAREVDLQQEEEEEGNSSPLLLHPGISLLPHPHFSLLTTHLSPHLNDFPLGPFRIVSVSDTQIGIKFRHRQPHILYPGRHCLSISRLEVFAGFESLLRRQSSVTGATATSKDNRELTADISVEWQIKPEDAAAARLANVTDVEVALCDRIRRAFIFAAWEVNAHEIFDDPKINPLSEPHPVLTDLSRNVQTECLALFDEGWTITIGDLQVKRLFISPDL